MVIVVYDLRDPDAWRAAHRHRTAWGKLYTDIHALGYDHVALVFRPAPDEAWRPWKRLYKDEAPGVADGERRQAHRGPQRIAFAPTFSNIRRFGNNPMQG